jgi:outer membrane protein
MRQFASFTIVALAYAATSFPADIGTVNFTTCITESELGKKEQNSMEALRKQIGSMMEQNETKLKDLATKLEDTEYMDSLSPKAEEELKLSYQTTQEELGRFQQQFYQIMQGANYQLIQKMSQSISTAAEKIAKEKKLDCVLNKEACFYSGPQYDVTSLVIEEMNRMEKENNLSQDEAPSAPSGSEAN